MTEGRNDKDSSENRLWLRPFTLPLTVQGESENIQSSDRLIINALGLFVLRVICPLCHFPETLKYPCPSLGPCFNSPAQLESIILRLLSPLLPDQDGTK